MTSFATDAPRSAQEGGALDARRDAVRRLEALFEAHGLAVRAVSDGVLVDDWAGMVLDGDYVDAVRAAEMLRAAGVTARADGDGLWIGAVARPSPALRTWLARLAEQNPQRSLLGPRRAVQGPPDGALPASAAALERLYGGQEFVPKEKKPVVADLRRSRGPWLCSVDSPPLVFRDAMSQIATLAHGFGPAPIQDALDGGLLDDALLDARAWGPAAARARQALEALVTRALHPALRHLTFANSGAEAVERALHLARRNGPGGRRIVAFEGSFHGRTLLALSATWNPAKRTPYEMPGFEATFAPFPVLADPEFDVQGDTAWVGWWSERRSPEERQRWLQSHAFDLLVAAEARSLATVEQALAAGDVCAVIVEPMQSEGGDRYATARFFAGLRALTRAWEVPLVFDEVQAGFGLAGPLAWHRAFELLRPDGTEDHPDAVVFAKRAQVGLVAAVWPDPWQPEWHPLHALRGARMAAALDPDHAQAVERRCRKHLARLATALPGGLVRNPRAHGYAFAFDLPLPAIANAVVTQRFYRGAMVYVAGDRTLRYRLNRSFGPDDIEGVFDAIEASLRALVDWAGGPGEGGAELWRRMAAVEVPSWVAPPAPPASDAARATVEAILDDPAGRLADAVLAERGDLPPAAWQRVVRELGVAGKGGCIDRDACCAAIRRAAADAAGFEKRTGVPLLHAAAALMGTRVEAVSPEMWREHLADIQAIEEAAYEPARRDDPRWLLEVVSQPGGVGVFAWQPTAPGRRLVGLAAGGPATFFSTVRGPADDPLREQTFYSADVTVHPEAQGRGIGRRLKLAQLAAAASLRDAAGRARYAFATSRNREGFTTAMSRLNERLGGYTAARYTGEYGEPDGVALYVRIPLRRWGRALEAPRPDASTPPGPHGGAGVCGTALASPHSAAFAAEFAGGLAEGGLLTKLTLSNFVTRDFARYVEALRELAPPGTRHLYLASGRAEMIDKVLKTVRAHRPSARVALSFEGGFAGTGTAAARSLSDLRPAGGNGRDDWFDWPRLPYPAASDADGDELTSAERDALSALEREVERAGGAERLFGVFVEPVQEMTGRWVAPRFVRALRALCDRLDVPLVLLETASGAWRNGRAAWWCAWAGVAPDAVLWFAGGQLGHVFVSDRWFLAKPLQLISTWDGDEVSAQRVLAALRCVEPGRVAALAQAFERAVRALDEGSAFGLVGGWRAGADPAPPAPIPQGVAWRRWGERFVASVPVVSDLDVGDVEGWLARAGGREG